MAIQFSCPHCGSPQNADERYAGMSGPCTSCGKTVAVPMVPVAGGMSPGKAAATGAGIGGVLLVVGIVCLVVVLGCGGVVVALLLPAIQSARTAARRMQSSNNEKQIMLALHNYHSTHGTFPPAYIADADGKPMTSWRVLILPYIEQSHLHAQYDFSKPWDAPENMNVANTMPAVFRSPLETDQTSNHTSYMLFTGPGSAFNGKDPANIAKITDGTSNTIALIETNQSGVVWTQPTDLDTAQLDFLIHSSENPRPGQINSANPQGVPVGFFDGSVRFLPPTTSRQELERAVDPDDGQVTNLNF